MHVCGLLTDDRSDDAGYTTDLDLDEVAADGAGAAADGGSVLIIGHPIGGDQEMDEAGFGTGRDHGDAGAGSLWVQVEHVNAGEAVGKVRW